MNSLNHIESLLSVLEHHICEMREEAWGELQTKVGKKQADKLTDKMLSHIKTINELTNKVNHLD